MGRPREGSIRKVGANFVVRVQWKDRDGKVRSTREYAKSKQEAIEIRSRLLIEIEAQDDGFNLHRGRFSQFAEWYKKEYLFPAEYVDGRKVAGRRSLNSTVPALGTLVAFFGEMKLRAIRYSDLERYKLTRLKQPLKRNPNKTVSIASVNRELSLLRRMFNVAVRQGYIIRSPFALGDPIISLADEKPRNRTLSADEEARLLSTCYGQRTHLRLVIIAALDTGMRRGEIFKLVWKDIDFERNVIVVKATNTKTLTERLVPMTQRLSSGLKQFQKEHVPNPEGRIFRLVTIRRSWGTACLIAGIQDLRFHDLRHTAGTRLERLGLSLTQVGQILGHTQPQTTWRYVNQTLDLIHQAGRLLDQWQEQSSEKLESEFQN